MSTNKELVFQLRTLLSGTLGIMEMAVNTQDTAELRELTDLAYRSAKETSAVLHQLLNLPHASANHSVPLSPAVNLTNQSDPVPRTQPQQPVTSPKKPLSILFAEDNPINQRVVSAILSKRGHKITLVTDGKKAVEMVKVQPFDVILMDIQMPGMDGLDAASFIRSNEKQNKLPHIPIVGLTAVGEADVYEISEVMDEIIHKPFDTSRLIRAVERAGTKED